MTTLACAVRNATVVTRLSNTAWRKLLLRPRVVEVVARSCLPRYYCTRKHARA